MNLKVKADSQVTVAPSGMTTVTWESASDTDTSHLIDVIARFETEADAVVTQKQVISSKEIA